MDKIVALCKRRGFIFPSSEIYGGLGSTYDYGHYGVLLKTNVKNEWWRAMLQERDDIVALDSAILQHPRVWEASGHLAGFTDPLVDCRACKQRFRADHVDREEMCPAKAQLPKTEDRRHDFTEVRAVQPDVRDARSARSRRPASAAYLRPETAQGIFINFKNVLQFSPQEAAVRHRPGRQVVPQRDHARQLHLPHARVRADGDGVLRPARRGAAVVRALEDRRASTGTQRLGIRPDHLAAARARRRRAQPLLQRHRRRRVPLPDRLVRAGGHRQPRRLRPHPAHGVLRREARVLRPGHAASATSRTSSSRPPAPTARRWPSSSTPTTRRRSRASRAPSSSSTRAWRRSRSPSCRWSARTASPSWPARSSTLLQVAASRPSTTRAARSASATAARTRSARRGA